jgi:hypothetical protein
MVIAFLLVLYKVLADAKEGLKQRLLLLRGE